MDKYKITKIYNEYYDLSNFKHPGGEIAIWHAFGRDSTVLFESYHVFTNKKNLKKF